MTMSEAGLEALIQAAQFLEENGASDTGAEVDIQTSGGQRKRVSRHRAKKPSPYRYVLLLLLLLLLLVAYCYQLCVVISQILLFMKLLKIHHC
jgi:hypothetical protein